MKNVDPRVDAYIGQSAPFARPILTHLRELIHTTCPDIEETWKWSFPNFMYKGKILCSMAAFKNYCTLSFWKAALIEDQKQVLETDNRESMGHLGKIKELADLPDDETLKQLIISAMKLTESGVKLPPRKKITMTEKQSLITPEYFQRELDKTEKAKSTFESFSYSHRKEYIEWLEEAKTEITRDKRMKQAIEWITEGKSRNWKY